MKRCIACALCFVFAASAVADTPKVVARGIIREVLKNDGQISGGDEAGIALSLNYKIKLVEGYVGDEPQWKTVDPADYMFEIGDQFRIEIEADTDLYVYVVFRDRTGDAELLVPDPSELADGNIPRVKKGKYRVVPDDDTGFKFVEPAGTDELLVYATREALFEEAELKKITPDTLLLELKKAIEANQDELAFDLEGEVVAQIAKRKDDEPGVYFRGVTIPQHATVEEGKTMIRIIDKDEADKASLFEKIELRSR